VAELSSTSTPSMPLSQFSGPALHEEPGIGCLTLPGFFYDVCTKYAVNEALYWRDPAGIEHRWTYAQMFQEAQTIARALLARGVTKHARVGVLISNRPEWILTCFGIAMAGGVVVALNTFSTEKELAYQLNVADVSVLFVEEGVANKSFLSMLSNMMPALTEYAPGAIHDDAFPLLRSIVCVDKVPLVHAIESIDQFIYNSSVVEQQLLSAIMKTCRPEDDGLIFFSSGSTALPKAIQQSHRAATLQSWRAGKWYELDESARFWSANGFFWSGNFAMALGATLSAGGCLVLQRYFIADEAVRLLSDQQVTCVFAWPHQYAQLKSSVVWHEADFSAMNRVDPKSVFGTHPTFNCDWQEPNGYGATETFTFVCGAVGRTIEDGSNGPVLPGNIVRIVDQNTGELVPLGQTGEIILKGPTTTRGYIGDPSEETFDENGFFHTNDAGYFTEQGNLVWIGRIGDMIKTGGANVSPAEIDEVLIKHAAVQTAYTVGLKDELLGERVISCVVPQAGAKIDEQELKAFAKHYLASYKVPKKILFFAAQDLPMTGSNKIKRGELKTLVAERLDSEV